MKVNVLEKCPICKQEVWKSLDYLRDKDYWFDRNYLYEEPVGFKICKECGFTTYDYRDNEELKQHYKAERIIMKSGNIVTCNRKNEYHKKFLSDTIKPDMKVLDLGMAQGAFLNMLHENYGVKKENLWGTEWSDGFRAFAKYQYGINAVEDVSDLKEDKFDLIAYYHVIEHIQHPDKEFEKAKSMLNKGGLIYMSTPIWFDVLEEPSGAQTADFENLYHMNHINVFSYQSFKNLLNNHNLEIVKEDRVMYGYTVLCKVNEDLKKEFKKEDSTEIVKIIKKQKEAIEVMYPKNPKDKPNPEKATQIYPKFPEAYLNLSVERDKMKEFDKAKECIERGIKIMPDSYKLKAQLALLYMQWDKVQGKQVPYVTNNVKIAEKMLNEMHELRPGDEGILYYLATLLGKYKHDNDEACKIYQRILEINPTKYLTIWDKIALEWLEKYEKERSNE